MTLWKITGEASNESGGGMRVVYAINDDSSTPPDAGEALRTASRFGEAWYTETKVEHIANFPAAWMDADSSHPLSEYAENQRRNC